MANKKKSAVNALVIAKAIKLIDNTAQDWPAGYSNPIIQRTLQQAKDALNKDLVEAVDQGGDRKAIPTVNKKASSKKEAT